MKVLLAASEAVPFIKTGGLADVMGALPAKLRREGVETALVIPKYSRVAERFGSQMETVWEGTVDLAWRRQYVGVEKIVLDGVPVFFIDNEYYFKRDGLYGFYDDGERFAYFCRALLAMLPHIGFRPDVIHSNDWHTGLVGVYLKENFQKDPFYQGMKSLFTIHNMKYQGIFSPEVVEDVLGLSRSLFDSGRIENNGCVNYLKAGMEYADAVNTVSPSYAEEIQYPYFGEGLDGYVRLCRGKITGILNGMDEKAYDPAEDPRIPYGYTDKDVFIRKPLDKEALQKELGLPVNRRIPVFAMISRLVEAKGLDLLTCIMDEMLQEDVQLVIVGTGDKAYEQALDGPGGPVSGQGVREHPVQRGSGPPGLCRGGFLPDALPVRSLRPEPDDFHEVRDHSRGPCHRRPEGFGAGFPEIHRGGQRAVLCPFQCP